jgi:hypothetical protein
VKKEKVMKLQLNADSKVWADVRKEGTHYRIYLHSKSFPQNSKCLQARGSLRLALADALIYGVHSIMPISGGHYDQNKLDKLLNQNWFDNLDDYLKSDYVAYFN